MRIKQQMMASFGVRKGFNMTVNFKEFTIHGSSWDKKEG